MASLTALAALAGPQGPVTQYRNQTTLLEFVPFFAPFCNNDNDNRWTDVLLTAGVAMHELNYTIYHRVAEVCPHMQQAFLIDISLGLGKGRIVMQL